ncbi:MAG: AraC family transcriptional regulator, partial [Pseudomonadota bacterium]
SLKDWRWRLPEDDRAQRRLGQLLVLLADPDSAEEQVIWDLLALSHHGGQPESSRPPAWLTEVRDALRDGQDDLSLGTLAREAGVHRVHLSRSFTRWFGTSPSLYRSRSALARALTAMATGQSLSRAANDAGFADQAHLHRIAKRQTGLTPGALCRLSRSGQVTSVQ